MRGMGTAAVCSARWSQATSGTVSISGTRSFRLQSCDKREASASAAGCGECRREQLSNIVDLIEGIRPGAYGPVCPLSRGAYWG